MRLPTAQAAVVQTASADEAHSIAALADATDLPPETVTGAVFELEDSGLVAVTERTEETLTVTEEGETYASAGLPEIRLYEAALEAGADTDPVQMGQVIGSSGLEGPEVNIALSNYARKGYGGIDSGEITADPDADAANDPEAGALEALIDGSADALEADILESLERRGLLERSERTIRTVTLTDDGVTAVAEGIETAETVGQLTPELLTSGEWREAEFAEYNVDADAERREGGRVHILRQTAERVKDTLVGDRRAGQRHPRRDGLSGDGRPPCRRGFLDQ